MHTQSMVDDDLDFSCGAASLISRPRIRWGTCWEFWIVSVTVRIGSPPFLWLVSLYLPATMWKRRNSGITYISRLYLLLYYTQEVQTEVWQLDSGVISNLCVRFLMIDRGVIWVIDILRVNVADLLSVLVVHGEGSVLKQNRKMPSIRNIYYRP